jgi:hypothetical protein
MNESSAPKVSEILDRMTPPEAVINHFRNARIEILKGIRELLNHRIQSLAEKQTKGTKLNVD